MGDPEDRVSARAYALWEAEGRPEGRHVDHWLQAEREMAGEGVAADGSDASLATGSDDASLDNPVDSVPLAPVDGPVEAEAVSPVDGPVEENSAEAGIEHVIERDEDVDVRVPGAASLVDTV